MVNKSMNASISEILECFINKILNNLMVEKKYN